MDAEQTPRPHPDVIWRVLEGEAVLILPHDGSVRVLNAVGTTIWSLLDGQTTVGEIERRVASTYGVTCVAVTKDVRQFLSELSSRGLLE